MSTQWMPCTLNMADDASDGLWPPTPPTSASPYFRHQFQERSGSRSLAAAWREQTKTTLSLAGGLALRKEAMGLACLCSMHCTKQQVFGPSTAIGPLASSSLVFP